MQSSVVQNGITITFDGAYPVGYYVTGDPFVVGSPTVTSISPGWDGSRNGATLNPSLDVSGYHSALNYDDSLNFAAHLPQQIPAGQALIATVGWLASDPEVQSLGITVTATPAAPRPCIRDSLVLTAVSEVPNVGSFRPPYVAGPKWQYNTSQIDWSKLANLTPTASAPSWSSVEQSLAKSWAPDAGYGSTTSRYLHPYNHMPDYGRDLCAAMYSAILRLNTDGAQAQKAYTLHRVIQYGIDTLAITRLANEVQFKISGAQTYPGWWADFGGGHGQGRDMPALLTKVVLGDPAELQAVWGLGSFWWGDCGQIWVSDGDPTHDPWRSAGLATWGESPHTRPGSRRPGTTGYRTCCTATSNNAGVLAAHAMGIIDQWNFSDAPIADYTDWYMDVDQVAAGNGSPRVIRAWFGEMWDAHRHDL